MVLMIDEHIL